MRTELTLAEQSELDRVRGLISLFLTPSSVSQLLFAAGVDYANRVLHAEIAGDGPGTVFPLEAEQHMRERTQIELVPLGISTTDSAWECSRCHQINDSYRSRCCDPACGELRPPWQEA